MTIAMYQKQSLMEYETEYEVYTKDTRLAKQMLEEGKKVWIVGDHGLDQGVFKAKYIDKAKGQMFRIKLKEFPKS